MTAPDRPNHQLKIAFVTQNSAPDFTGDDAIAAAELCRRGCVVEATPWDREETAEDFWRGFDAVVLRSPWNYYLEPAKFLGFIESLRDSGVRVLNGPQIVHWNINKRYLQELACKGVPVLPTEFLSEGDGGVLARLARERGWEEVVLKPALSAGGWETLRLKAGALATGVIDAWMARHAASRGAMLQEEHGGAVEAFKPGSEELAFADGVLRAMTPALRDSSEFLYARVDAVQVGKELLLMELEVLEPALYFRFSPGAAGDFADALLSRL